MPNIKRNTENTEITPNEHQSDESVVSGEAIEFVTSDGRQALRLTLPIAKIEVELVKISVKILISVEREVNKYYKGAGEIEKNLILLSHIIIKYGELSGDRCTKFDNLVDLDLIDLTFISQALETFFSA